MRLQGLDIQKKQNVRYLISNLNFEIIFLGILGEVKYTAKINVTVSFYRSF